MLCLFIVRAVGSQMQDLGFNQQFQEYTADQQYNQSQSLVRRQMSEQLDTHVIAQYKIIKKIGSGAYGHVFKVQDRKTKCLKALKKNFDAFSNSTDAQRVYREIMFLQQLSHPNIIKLQRIMKANNNIDIYLIFEHMDVDLHTLIREATILEEKHKKYIIYQICKALYYLHNSDIIHRDLKPSNVLVNEECQAKLCDFGLVRLLEEPDQNQMAIMTDYIATRWYRAPELLMGCHSYSKEIDIWSLGCMIGEIVKGRPLFQGTSTINQLEKILSWSGCPSNSEIKSMKVNMNQAILDVLQTRRRVNKPEILGSDNKKLLDLVSKTLQFDPNKRITIEQILKHPYLQQFYNGPEIQSIKKTHVNLKLHMNDNTKLSVKNYRNLIYGHIEDKSKLDNFTNTKLQINLDMIQNNGSGKQGSSNNTTCHPRETEASQSNQSRYSALRESKTIGSNKKILSNSKERSVSRKKGISLCSKELETQKMERENGRHHRSIMGTVTMYTCSSNQKYKRIVSKDNRVSKKIQEVKKKNSLNNFLSSAAKVKSSYSGLPI